MSSPPVHGGTKGGSLGLSFWTPRALWASRAGVQNPSRGHDVSFCFPSSENRIPDIIGEGFRSKTNGMTHESPPVHGGTKGGWLRALLPPLRGGNKRGEFCGHPKRQRAAGVFRRLFLFASSFRLCQGARRLRLKPALQPQRNPPRFEATEAREQNHLTGSR